MKQNQSLEKNYFMAIALSALVLFVYFALVKPPQPAEAPANETKSGQTAASAPAVQAVAAAAAKSAELAAAQPASLVKMESPALTLELSSLGATATQLGYKGEKGREALTQTSFFQVDPEVSGMFAVAIRGQAEHLGHSTYRAISSTPTEAVYQFEDADLRTTKTYRVVENNPAIQLEVTFENLSAREKTYPVELTYGFDYEHIEGHPPGRYYEAIVFTNGLKTANLGKMEKKGLWVSEPAAWTALVKSYFALIVRPDRKITETRAEARDGKVKIISSLDPVTVAPGASTTVRFKIYAGPQRYEMLKKFEEGFEAVLSRGFFGFFKVWLLLTLKFLNQFTHNYGWAIVLLTLLIKLVFAPLTAISSKSMKKMQALAPKQKALQEKFKNDPQRLQQEVMGLYKRNKVNPISGCLPMLVQLPILIAMFQLLPEAIELHGAPFIFWIKDLSGPDQFFQLPWKLPFLGEWIHLLPFVMVASQIGYQKMMPSTAIQPEQKMIMNIMPFFFGFISWSFPSGLVLYWIFQNIFSMAQQLWINRIQTELHPEDRE